MSGMHSSDGTVGLERVTTMLRRLPPTSAGATDRIVAAALRRQHRARRQRAWLAAAAGLTLAAGLGAGGTLLYQRGATTTTSALTAAAPESAPRSAAVGSAQFAAAGAAEEALVSVPFVVRLPTARRVALVGDFDAWNPTAIPMTRGPDGTWTVAVSLTPGRHAYAFVVDDTVWVTDPRSETVPDADYGRPHSVIVVGAP